MTVSGIEPATCRFIAWCLNHYATVCPIIYQVHKLNNVTCVAKISAAQRKCLEIEVKLKIDPSVTK